MRILPHSSASFPFSALCNQLSVRARPRVSACAAVTTKPRPTPRIASADMAAAAASAVGSFKVPSLSRSNTQFRSTRTLMRSPSRALVRSPSPGALASVSTDSSWRGGRSRTMVAPVPHVEEACPTANNISTSISKTKAATCPMTKAASRTRPDSSAETLAVYSVAKLRAKRWWVIDPRKSRWMSTWDAVTTVALLYTAVVTPFEVAFLTAPQTWEEALHDGLFMINRVVDLVFVLDFMLQFAVMYKVEDAVRGVKWVDDPKLIAHNYVHSWFLVDIFSTLPSLCDFVPLMMAGDGTGGDGGTDLMIARLKNFRVVRCVRLVRLMRLLRASRMFKRWETRIAINCASHTQPQSPCLLPCFACACTSAARREGSDGSTLTPVQTATWGCSRRSCSTCSLRTGPHARSCCPRPFMRRARRRGSATMASAMRTAV